MLAGYFIELQDQHELHHLRQANNLKASREFHFFSSCWVVLEQSHRFCFGLNLASCYPYEAANYYNG